MEADQDLTNASALLAPYALAQQQAQNLIDDGFVLQTKKTASGQDEPTDEACKPDGGNRNCVRADTLVVLFYIIFKPIIDLVQDGKVSDSNEFVKFLKWINKPLGGPNNDLRKIREAILMGDYGEIARLIRIRSNVQLRS